MYVHICKNTSIRFTAAEVISAENCWSRNTVRPSLSVSWNQSRHVTRLPVLYIYVDIYIKMCVDI